MRAWLITGSVALLAAIPPIWPYGYYTLLRLLVCGVSIAGIVTLREKAPSTIIPFCLVALLFNPLIPIHLTKEIWAVIDLVTAIFFGLVARHAALGDAQEES